MNYDNENEVKIYMTNNICDLKSKFLFLSGKVEDNKFYDSYSYYGSSTRLGKEFEIYNEDGYKNIKLEILLEDNLLFDEIIDFKELAVEHFIESNEEFRSIRGYDSVKDCEEKINKIKNEDYCEINSFTKFRIKRDNIDIYFGFRDLHKFNNNIELCSLSFSLY